MNLTDLLDIRTITFVLFLQTLLLGSVFLFFSYVKKQYPGTRELAFSLLCIALSMMLYSLQNITWFFLSVFIGNVINVTGVLLTPYGFRKFFGYGDKFNYYSALMAISIILLFFFNIIFPEHVKMRQTTLCLVSAAAFYETFYLLFTSRIENMKSITRTASFVYFILATIYAVRIIVMPFIGDFAINMMSATALIERTMLLTTLMFGLICSVCAFTLFILMVNFKLEGEIIESGEKLKEYSHNLEKSDAAKDKFLSIISHDLRNPVDGMATLFSAMSADEKLPASIAPKVEILKKTSDGIALLLANLLDWARAQTGNIEIKFEKIGVSEIAAETIKILEIRAKQKNIAVKCEEMNDKFVYADRRMLSTIFRHLLSNAIKFTHKNGAITLCATLSGGKTEIYFRDNGIGMSDEKIERLFGLDRSGYYRDGTAGETGTGLGLLVCREFAALNGGTLSMESLEGKGTTVVLTLLSEIKV